MTVTTAAEHSRQLVARFQNGDAGAFGEIYQQHRDGVFAVLYSRCQDKQLAEDLTQDTFVRAWGGLARWEWQGKSVFAFLCTIAGNLLTDHRKRLSERMTSADFNARDWALDRLVDDSPDGHPDEKAIGRVMLADLEEAMEALTDDQRTCLRLRFIEGMRVMEVAAATGRHKQAVISMTRRATQAMASHLGVYARYIGGNDV